MLKEILTTAVAVALGVILADIVTAKLLKGGSWEEDWEED